MEAQTALKNGDLAQALQQLKDNVRSDPSNAKYRIFLFQLFAVLGEWDKASEQLNTAGVLDASVLGLSAVYATALECERQRAEVFAGQATPTLLGQPERWHALLIEGCRQSARGALLEASQLRQEAFGLAPASPCEVNGVHCAWIADGDSRLGPVLEVILNGEYRWVPFDRIRSIVIDAPSDLRDLVWIPATFTWKNGGVSAALIPARYCATERCADAQLQMSRRTEWLPLSDGEYRGLGQKLLVTDQQEFALLDLRRVDFLDEAAD